MVFLYALRVSGFHCCRAKTCTICSVVTSLGPDGMSSHDRWIILYRRLLMVCADRPAALRVSVHPSMFLRHGTGALILFLMIHHGHPDLHAAKLSLDKLRRSPMDLNRGPLVSPEVQGSNPCPATAGEAVTIIRDGFSFIRRRALRGRISDRGDDVLWKNNIQARSGQNQSIYGSTPSRRRATPPTRSARGRYG